MKNNTLPPAIIHGAPLAYSQIITKPGDPPLTLYPGDDLPEEVLQLIVNTRKGKEWSYFLWANIFLLVVLNFLDFHKGGVIRKHKDFTLFAIHPNSYQYHYFKQDWFYGTVDHVRSVPYHRATYLKSCTKVTFDAAWTFTWKNGVYVSRKVLDPKNLFPENDHPFTQEEVNAATEGLV